MTIPQQLLTAFLILVSLPLVLKLLWKVRLLPFVLGLSLPYLMGQQWAAEHKAVYLVLLIGGALFALAVWTYPHRGCGTHGAMVPKAPFGTGNAAISRRRERRLTVPLFFAVTASKGYIALYFVPPYIPAG